MKIWFGYGSEHSANLVMLGQFRTEADASKVRRVFERITEAAQSSEEQARVEQGERGYSDSMLALLSELGAYSFGPSDPEAFSYDYSLAQEGSKLTLRTEEPDVGAYLKLMIDGGAKVEVYSAHDYPDPTSDDA